MYSAIVGVHSLIRWVVLLAALVAVARGIAGWNKSRWMPADGRAGMLFVAALDIQLLLGLLLYLFFSPVVRTAFSNLAVAMKASEYRYFLVDHPAGMLVAIVLAHIGRVRTRKAMPDEAKHRAAAVFYGLALLLILLTIPWPGMPGGRPLWPW
jgi:hypothetical protein